MLNYKNDVKEKQNIIIYVGNVKPHKGLKTLIEAYKMLPAGKYRLKIIGEREGFLTGMDSSELNAEGVEFTGKLTNNDLMIEIASASFLVQPSLYEGFGLPPLEALYLGTKPIVSDIPIFKEIYGDFDVEYFKGENPQDLVRAITNSNSTVCNCKELITKKFNYKQFEETLMCNVVN